MCINIFVLFMYFYYICKIFLCMDNKEFKNGYEFYLSLPKYGKKQVLSYSGLTQLQDFISQQKQKGQDPKFICAQKGSQEMMQSCPFKTILLWGNRGGGKSFSCLHKILPHINHPLFTGIAARKMKSDADKTGGLVDTSRILYENFGEYLESQSLRNWRFNKGGRLRFENFSEPTIEAYKEKIRGLQLQVAFVDEITQLSEDQFNFLLTSLRSLSGKKSLLLGACNPDSSSFIYRLINAYWINELGAPIINRNGVVRYYFKYGGGDEDIIWGSTKREVYRKAKNYIDEIFSEEELRSNPEKAACNLISEIVFINVDLSGNRILLDAQPDYKSRLNSGSEEERATNLLGIWRPMNNDLDVITDTDMLNFFGNTPQYDDMMEYATLDPAYGGDMAVMCHWIGHHLQDLAFTKDVDGTTIVNWTQGILAKWDLPENRLAFDAWGANYIKSSMKNSKPILGAVIDIRNRVRNEQARFLYTDLKTQMADGLINNFRNKKYSINPALLGLQYGNGTVRKTMMRQKSAIRFKPENLKGKMSIIEKQDMKKILGGGESPDLIEAILYREYWDLVKPQNTISKKKLNSLMYL